MANKNITLKKIGFDTTFLNSRLELNVKGKDVSYPLVNAIRRIALSDLPIYTWKTTITKNNSVFHNNYMKNRIRSIPIIGINNDMLFLKNHKESDVNDEDIDNFLIMDNVDINSENNSVDTSSLNNINMYLNYHNTSKEIATVTTDKCTFQYKGEKINNPYKIPIPIIKLQPNQEINLSSVSKLGTEQNNTSEYSACSIFCYDMTDENNYNLFLESRGQLTEKKILLRSIDILKKQLLDLDESITDKNEMVGTIKVGDQDHTLGNLVSYYSLQDKNVDMFSYNLPHPLERVVNFNYKLNKGELKDVFSKSTKKIISDLDTIYVQIEKLKL
tara:strand:+ start:1417 stop:2406 length:990 start_codon:yes stop_codon:yes gene_type:complete